MMIRYIVEEKDNGKRLDAYIASQNTEITRTSAQRLIQEEHILVNGKKQKVAYKVTAGDKIIVKTHDKKYTYVIEENYIVNPDQVEVLDATENATITLITCTVGSKQRVIVKGTLQSTEDL